MKLLLFVLLLLPVITYAGENSAGRTRTGDVGDALEIAMPVAALTATLWQKDYEGSKQFGMGLAATLAATHALKAVISKERPDGRDDESFPSAHTAITMHTASFVHRRYGIRYAWPGYVLAAFVGHSRVHDERHDEQDVIVGAALGFLAGRYLTTEYRDVQIAPVLGADMVGISLSYRH